MLSGRPVWLLGVAVVVAAGLGAYSSVLLTSDNDLLCEAVNENRASIRNLLVSARNQTPKARLNKRARDFYREQIALVSPLDCGSFDRDSLDRLREDRARARGGDAPTTGESPKSPP